MISTKEVMKFLIKKYNLEIDQSLIFKYAAKGLITKEQKIGQGKSKGVQTFWEDSAPAKIYAIKELLKQSLTLDDIKKYKDTIYNFNGDTLAYYFSRNIDNSINIIERGKFRTVLTYFASAQASLKGYNKLYSLIRPVANNDKKITEIHVILKDLSIPEIWDSIEHVKTRFKIDQVILKNEGMMIESQEELNILNNLKTVKEIIFSKDKIQVL